jgi:hypothetical protein
MHFGLITTRQRKVLHDRGLLAPAIPAPPDRHAEDEALLPSVPDEPDWLPAWHELPRRPVHESFDEVVFTCIEAAERGETLSLYYHGGTHPGRLRRFNPFFVFQMPIHEHRYVSGYCHLRRAPRVLRVDRISLA